MPNNKKLPYFLFFSFHLLANFVLLTKQSFVFVPSSISSSISCLYHSNSQFQILRKKNALSSRSILRCQRRYSRFCKFISQLLQSNLQFFSYIMLIRDFITWSNLIVYWISVIEIIYLIIDLIVLFLMQCKDLILKKTQFLFLLMRCKDLILKKTQFPFLLMQCKVLIFEENPVLIFVYAMQCKVLILKKTQFLFLLMQCKDLIFEENPVLICNYEHLFYQLLFGCDWY